MRRFILAALFAAALIAFLSPDTPDTSSPSAASIVVAEPPKTEPSSSHERGPVALKPASQVAAVKVDALAPARSEPSESERIAAAHIPSSAKAGGIDPARPEPMVAEADLASTAQRELTRLGCYGAGVDGVWGPQSRVAVRRFGQRANGDWQPEPSRALISALRTAPDGFCTDRCARGQCALASAGTDSPAPVPPGGEGASYLPPWMRGANVANVEPDAVLPGAQPVISDAGQGERKVKPRPERRRSEERRSGERRSQRSTFSAWQGPDGWPGTSR